MRISSICVDAGDESRNGGFHFLSPVWITHLMTLCLFRALISIVYCDSTRCVKSSRSKASEDKILVGLDLALKALASASALASNIWPRSAAEEPAAEKKSTYQSVCTYFAHYRTSLYDRR